MSYDQDYKKRPGAKKHFTRIYSSEELQEIIELIKKYYHNSTSLVVLNTNEAYFITLADAINDASFPGLNVIKPKYLCQIYNDINPINRKSIEKMTAIRDFLRKWLGTPTKESNPFLSPETKEWRAKTVESTPQWTDYIELLLRTKKFKRLMCNVTTKTKYYRLGFKFTQIAGKLFGDGSIQSQDNNFIIHVGKNFLDKDIFITSYRNGIRERSDKYTKTFPKKNSYSCEIFFDSDNIVHMLLNNVEVYKNVLPKELRERVYLVAWGDGNEYEIVVNNIEIETENA